MAGKRIDRGGPPKVLSGRMSVASMDSPWWDRVMSELTSRPDLVGRTLSIGELTQIVPSYPGGRRPRSRAVARRLRPILELVSRGPNGSLGNGATYRIMIRDVVPSAGDPTVEDNEIAAADEWLQQAVKRMTGEE